MAVDSASHIDGRSSLPYLSRQTDLSPYSVGSMQIGRHQFFPPLPCAVSTAQVRPHITSAHGTAHGPAGPAVSASTPPAVVAPGGKLPWGAVVRPMAVGWLLGAGAVTIVGCAVGAMLYEPWCSVGVLLGVAAVLGIWLALHNQAPLRRLIRAGGSASAALAFGLLRVPTLQGRLDIAHRINGLEMTPRAAAAHMLTTLIPNHWDTYTHLLTELTAAGYRDGTPEILARASHHRREALCQVLSATGDEVHAFTRLAFQLSAAARSVLLEQALTDPQGLAAYSSAVLQIDVPGNVREALVVQPWGRQAPFAPALPLRQRAAALYCASRHPALSSRNPSLLCTALGLVARSRAHDRHAVAQRCQAVPTEARLSVYASFMANVPAERILAALQTLDALDYNSMLQPCTRARLTHDFAAHRGELLWRLQPLAHHPSILPLMLQGCFAPQPFDDDVWQRIYHLFDQASEADALSEHLSARVTIWQLLPNVDERSCFDQQVLTLWPTPYPAVDLLVAFAAVSPSARRAVAARARQLDSPCCRAEIASIAKMKPCQWLLYKQARNSLGASPSPTEIEAVAELCEAVDPSQRASIVAAMRTAESCCRPAIIALLQRVPGEAVSAATVHNLCAIYQAFGNDSNALQPLRQCSVQACQAVINVAPQPVPGWHAGTANAALFAFVLCPAAPCSHNWLLQQINTLLQRRPRQAAAPSLPGDVARRLVNILQQADCTQRAQRSVASLARCNNGILRERPDLTLPLLLRTANPPDIMLDTLARLVSTHAGGLARLRNLTLLPPQVCPWLAICAMHSHQSCDAQALEAWQPALAHLGQNERAQLELQVGIMTQPREIVGPTGPQIPAILAANAPDKRVQLAAWLASRPELLAATSRNPADAHRFVIDMEALLASPLTPARLTAATLNCFASADAAARRTLCTMMLSWRQGFAVRQDTLCAALQRLASIPTREHNAVVYLAQATHAETGGTRPFTESLQFAERLDPAARAPAYRYLQQCQTSVRASWAQLQGRIWQRTGPVGPPLATLAPADIDAGVASRWQSAAWQIRDAEVLAHHRLPANVSAARLARAARCRGDLDLAIFALHHCEPGHNVLHDNLELFDLYLERRQGNDIDLAHTLFEDGHRHAMQAAAVIWGGTGPLPNYVIGAVASRYADDPGSLFTFVGSLELAFDLRHSLVLAALEVALHPAAGVPRLTRPAAGFRCAVCLEDKGGAEAGALVACTCPHTTCWACLRSGMEAAHQGDRCPTACGGLLTRQDMERLGLTRQQVETRLQRLLRMLLAQRPSWVGCQTPNCLAGYDGVPSPPAVNLCDGCTRASQTRPAEDLEPTLIGRLLDGLAASPQADGAGVTRECYSCGIPTEKGPACMHMTCPRCRANWDFERGPYGGVGRFMQAGIGPQTFRPLRDGMLGKLGFYGDIPRGPLDAGMQATLMAQRDNWRQRYPASPQ